MMCKPAQLQMLKYMYILKSVSIIYKKSVQTILMSVRDGETIIHVHMILNNILCFKMPLGHLLDPLPRPHTLTH